MSSCSLWIIGRKAVRSTLIPSIQPWHISNYNMPKQRDSLGFRKMIKIIIVPITMKIMNAPSFIQSIIQEIIDWFCWHSFNTYCPSQVKIRMGVHTASLACVHVSCDRLCLRWWWWWSFHGYKKRYIFQPLLPSCPHLLKMFWLKTIFEVNAKCVICGSGISWLTKAKTAKAAKAGHKKKGVLLLNKTCLFIIFIVEST